MKNLTENITQAIEEEIHSYEYLLFSSALVETHTGRFNQTKNIHPYKSIKSAFYFAYIYKKRRSSFSRLIETLNPKNFRYIISILIIPQR